MKKVICNITNEKGNAVTNQFLTIAELQPVIFLTIWKMF